MPDARTLLCACIEAEDVEAVKLLIDKGVLVDRYLPRTTNNTPLHVAVHRSRHCKGPPDAVRRIVQLLLEAGADTEVVSNEGRRPDDAMKGGDYGIDNEEVLELIRKFREDKHPPMQWESALIHGDRTWTEIADAEISRELTAAFQKQMAVLDRANFQASFNDWVITFYHGQFKREHCLLRRKHLGAPRNASVKWVWAENLPGKRWEEIEPLLQPTLEKMMRSGQDAPRLKMHLAGLQK